ncbi:hypothetical protein COLO4_20867 [Corchorus olitorius]|uniref:DUF4283 domain-containing protein n=1 Tax=Corchorus olitorius TaxID=93759 RepID=A0A1R3IWC3_9ROSI|nr:hypothetical protein COLO4_20867 [Corchorus olitorius]
MAEPNQINIKFLRECSWTDSDSPTEESEEKIDSNIQAVHPRPAPPFRSRLSHKIRLNSEDIMETREEANKCIVGFMLDMRRFPIESIQRWVQQEWEPTSEVSVIGRDDNRYLIYFSDDTDRQVAIEQTPWNFQGAFFATRKWNPNIPLGEIVLDRIELWLQIWGLPIEYQNAVAVGKLARTAGEVIRIDWRHQRPRNIRFLRVRIALDPRQPLAAGCTLEMDDGTVRWINFSYEKVNKLCLSCGMLGHTHPYCSKDAVEVDRLARQRMRPIIERYGHPIVTDPQNNFFSNEMRAFLHRAIRRTTKIAYGERRSRQNQIPLINMENSAHYERGSLSGTTNQNLELWQVVSGNELQTVYEDVAAEEAQMTATEPKEQRTSELENTRNLGGEEVQAQLQSLMLRDEPRESPQDIVASLEELQVIETTQIIEISESTETLPLENGLDDNIADTLQSLQDLHHPIQPQPQPNQVVPLEPDLQIFEYPTMEPLIGPLIEFDNSVERLEQLEERHSRGLQNMADIEDMQFALNREHDRFENICNEIVRQSAEMLEGLQNRHLNDPTVQPSNNSARWINLPQGGVIYTNARLQTAHEQNTAESSQMGVQRREQRWLRTREELEFELNLQMEQQKLRMVESQVTLNPSTRENINSTSQPTNLEGQSSTLLLESGSPVNPASPGFICTVNEENLVSAFLRDTPSPDSRAEEEEKEQPDDNQHQEESNRSEVENQCAKRKRIEDESSVTTMTGGRNVKQRMGDSGKESAEVGDNNKFSAEGSRLVVPQQQPKGP